MKNSLTVTSHAFNFHFSSTFFSPSVFRNSSHPKRQQLYVKFIGKGFDFAACLMYSKNIIIKALSVSNVIMHFIVSVQF